MAEPLGNVPAVTLNDPRMKIGAYVTNGTTLYEVTAITRPTGPWAGSLYYIELENCRNETRICFTLQKIREGFELVKGAPTGDVPDDVEHIAWEAA